MELVALPSGFWVFRAGPILIDPLAHEGFEPPPENRDGVTLFGRSARVAGIFLGSAGPLAAASCIFVMHGHIQVQICVLRLHERSVATAGRMPRIRSALEGLGLAHDHVEIACDDRLPFGATDYSA